MINFTEEYQVTDANGEDVYYEDTEADAVKLAKHLIRESLVNGEWEGDPRLIKVSKVMYEVEEFDRVEKPLTLSSDNEDETGEHWPTQCDFKCGYQLVKAPCTIEH